MAGFHVDFSALRNSADGLGGVVDRLDDAIAAHEARIAAFGEPWGGDDLGLLIGECYLAIHDMALGCFENNADVLDEFADGLTGMADSYESTEQSAADGFTGTQRSFDDYPD